MFLFSRVQCDCVRASNAKCWHCCQQMCYSFATDCAFVSRKCDSNRHWCATIPSNHVNDKCILHIICDRCCSVVSRKCDSIANCCDNYVNFTRCVILPGFRWCVNAKAKIQDKDGIDGAWTSRPRFRTRRALVVRGRRSWYPRVTIGSCAKMCCLCTCHAILFSPHADW